MRGSDCYEENQELGYFLSFTYLTLISLENFGLHSKTSNPSLLTFISTTETNKQTTNFFLLQIIISKNFELLWSFLYSIKRR